MDGDKLLKYLNGSASFKEKKEIEDWIGSAQENTEKFNLFKARHIASTFDETSEIANIDEGLKRYKNNVRRSSKNRQHRIWAKTLKYAALIAVVLGGAYLFNKGLFTKAPILSVPKDAITLKLENGDIQVIEENGASQIIDSKGNIVGTQQGTQLLYNNEAPTEKLTYNTLTVPYGKRFDLFLSDSTHVTLNSGTSIKYPLKFIKGENREVYLTGEAFFEVAKDEAHPFVVNVNRLKIRVLGTKFNVSAYPEDSTTNTMLVEGSIGLYKEAVYDSTKTTFLTPGHLASLNKTNMDIMVEKAETTLYTAWIHGDIVFRHVPFKDIIKKLERHYNVIITTDDDGLDKESFTASFDNPTLEHVLKTFKDNYGINYTINNNKITINH